MFSLYAKAFLKSIKNNGAWKIGEKTEFLSWYISPWKLDFAGKKWLS